MSELRLELNHLDFVEHLLETAEENTILTVLVLKASDEINKILNKPDAKIFAVYTNFLDIAENNGVITIKGKLEYYLKNGYKINSWDIKNNRIVVFSNSLWNKVLQLD